MTSYKTIAILTCLHLFACGDPTLHSQDLDSAPSDTTLVISDEDLGNKDLVVAGGEGGEEGPVNGGEEGPVNGGEEGPENGGEEGQVNGGAEG